MDCKAYQELASRMLDEDLSVDEQRALRAHIETCPNCRRTYEAFRALSDAVGNDLEEPPERLHHNIMAQIRREEIQKKNRRPTRVLLTTAACLAVIVGITMSSGLFSPKGSSASMLAAGRSAPQAPAAAMEEAAEAAPQEMEAAMDEAAEPEAAQAEANFVMAGSADTSAAAASKAAAEPRSYDSYDLSGLSAEDLLSRLPLAETEDEDRESAEILCAVAVSDGELLFFRDGEELFCREDGGNARVLNCTEEELYQILQDAAG